MKNEKDVGKLLNKTINVLIIVGIVLYAITWIYLKKV